MNGMMLGMALALTGWAAGAEVGSSDGAAGMVSFQVRMLEMPGLEWRTEVWGQLQKVGGQSGVTVWTGPVSVLAELEKRADGIILAPRVTCLQGYEASVSTGVERHFVAYMHRKSDGPLMQAKAVAFQPEVKGCQDGVRAKLTGACMDQGTLVKVDLEESQIAAIHSVVVKDGVVGTEENGFRSKKMNAMYQVPELLKSQVQGEWLVAKDQVLVMSLGVRSWRGSEHELRERVVVVEPVVGTGPGMLPVPKTAQELMPKESPSLPFTGVTEEEGPGLLGIVVPMVSPVAGWVIAGLSAIEVSEPEPMPTFGKIDTRLGLTSALANSPITVVNGHPELPSRHIPQGFAADGEPVELPPLPPSSTAEPEITSEPMGTPQGKTFPPSSPAVSSPTARAALASASASDSASSSSASAPAAAVVAEPVPMAVSELSGGQGNEDGQPVMAVVAGSRIELTGNVRIKATDGTVMEADSAVVTTPGQVFESSETAENDGYGLDFEEETPDWVGNRQATGPGVDQKVAQASASASADGQNAKTFIQRIPVLGGAIELKVRVSHGKEGAKRP